jgi:V/A-type H+-transporting ATPase subunit D
MGVVVPKIAAEAVQKKMYERGYGIIGTGAAIDEAADAYEGLLDKIILAAEVETAMIRLVEDIDSTKRRVNALEFKVVPDLKLTIKFISMALEEMERDNLVKMKMLKGKSERKAAAELAKKEAEIAAAALATA